MPCAPDLPPTPKSLHEALNNTRPLVWDTDTFSVAEMTRLHGAKATTKSLELLQRTVAVEPQVTTEFLDSLPVGSAPYHLDRRVKSPESLARKIRDRIGKDNRRPIEDLLRYTVLTESPDDLVAATRRTADALAERGWRVQYAMHSYTDGSRYKGIHAYLRTPDVERVEVQWHSAVSARIKELTTPWYEIERSASATDDERTAAREKCVEASAGLRTPAGIDTLTELDGRRVAVKNYSDSRQAVPERRPGAADSNRRPTAAHDRGKGIAR